MYSREPAQVKSAVSTFDWFAVVPALACGFALILDPLLQFFSPTDPRAVSNGTAAALDNRIFWPVIAAISVLLAFQSRSRLAQVTWPPHITSLFAFLSWAGTSVLWASSQQSSFVRFVQQAMVVISVVLPVMLTQRPADVIRGLFLCFALALVINLLVLNGSIDKGNCSAKQFCYEGYFQGKNYLGECAAAAFLLSFHEMAHRGWRRASAVIVAAIAIFLVVMSDSKTAFGIIIISPLLALLVLSVRKITRLSLALILLLLPLSYMIILKVSHVDLIGRMAYILYGDSTLTGRTIIWQFLEYEIVQSPLLGWGYQSFWLVPGSPARAAPGWVKMMPEGHNGYYDMTVELGYVGLTFLYVFILSTLHGIGRVADRYPTRAWALLSFALFFIIWNYFESLWMRGFEFLWIAFIIVSAVIGRYLQPLPRPRTSYRPRGATVLLAERPRLSFTRRDNGHGTSER
jgi:O-antigen ligase